MFDAIRVKSTCAISITSVLFYKVSLPVGSDLLLAVDQVRFFDKISFLLTPAMLTFNLAPQKRRTKAPLPNPDGSISLKRE
jgi:hypothetical protein